MLEEIERSRQELSLLTSKMIKIQEEERSRPASDIHDSLAQTLTGICYKAQLCKELLKNEPPPKLLIGQLAILVRMVQETINQTKNIMTNLRPDLIDNIGLIPALRKHIKTFMKETGIQINASIPDNIQIPSELNICLFRVVQESLANIFKHAETKYAELILESKGENITLIVADKGKGFDVLNGAPWIKDLNKMGVLFMKKRVETLGGTFNITAFPNQGCRIEIKFLKKRDHTNEQDSRHGCR